MTRLFVSYSSTERAEARSVQAWLEANGWKDDVFVDIDPRHGLAGGEVWRSALREAAGRCEAVILLLSRAWLGSKACWSEFMLAEKYGKPCIPIRIDENLAFDALPPEIANVYQVIDKVAVPDSEFELRLKRALEIAGAGPENFPLAVGRRPYPGLQALNEQDAALFFGRDAEVLAGLDALREMRTTGRRRLLVILGASGAGKSSLVRAGLWPRLNRNDRQFIALPVIRPANAVLTGKEGLWVALETACADPRHERHLPSGSPRTRAAIRARVEQDSRGLAPIVDDLKQASHRALGESTAANPSVVLTIDQAEELFNAEGIAEAAALLNLLAAILEQDPEFLTILSIRSDIYPRLQSDRRINQSQVRLFNLPPMSAAAFAEVIEGPAEKVGLELDPQLPAALLEGATGADALPLLAFTLERLVESRLDKKTLRLADYRTMGGVKGAIEAAVDQARAEAKAQGIEGGQLDSLLRRTFLPHLARVNEAGEFARRLADIRDFAPECLPLLKILVSQRLLVLDLKEGITTVEIAHEAILREWPLLSGWLDAERGFLEWREQVARARALYRRQQGDLLAGRALLISQGFLEARSESINDDDRQFIDESGAAEARRLAEEEAAKESKRLAELEAAKAREETALATAAAEKRLADAAQRTSRIMRLVALAMLILAAGAMGAGYLAYLNKTAADSAADQARTAADQEREAREGATKAQESAEDAARKARHEQNRAEAETLRANTERARAESAAKLAEQARSEREASRLAALAEDVRLREQDAKAHALAWLSLPHQEAVLSQGSTDGASSIYRRSAYPVKTFSGHAKTVFSPDGGSALTTLLSGVAELWDTRTGAVRETFQNVALSSGSDDSEELEFAEFTRGGRSLLLAHKGDVLRHWDITQRKVLREYQAWYAALSPNRARMFIVRDGGQAEVHDLATSGKVVRMRMPANYFDDSKESEKRSYNAGVFSSTAKYFVAIFGEDNGHSAELWNAETGRFIAKLNIEGGLLDESLGIQFTSDDKLLLISPDNRDVTLWNPQTGKLVHRFPTPSGSRQFRFSNDEKHIVGVWENRLSMLTLRGVLTRTLPTPADYEDFDSSRRIAITATADEALVWNVETGIARARLRGQGGKVESVKLSPDGKLALTHSSDKVVRLWDAERGRMITTLRPVTTATDPPYANDRLGFDALGSSAFFEEALFPEYDDKGEKVLPIKPERRAIQILRVNADKPQAVASGEPAQRVNFLEDGRLITSGADGKVKIISLAEERAFIPHHAGQIAHQHISANGRWLVTGSWDGTARIWDIGSLRLLTTLKGHSSGVASVEFGPRAELVATGSHDGTAKLWSISVDGTGSLKSVLEVTNGSVAIVKFNRAGDRLITATLDGKLAAWDTVSGQRLFNLDGHDGPISAVELDPDGLRILTASADYTAKVWDATTGRLLQMLKGHEGPVNDATWSTDGQLFLTASSDRTVKLWNLGSPEPRMTFSGALDAVHKAAFSPDGKLALAIADDNTLRLWDIESGAQLATHAGHNKTLLNFAISKGGELAATTGADGLINLWNLFPSTLRQRIAEVGESFRDRAPLSADECAQYRIKEARGAKVVCQTSVAP